MVKSAGTRRAAIAIRRGCARLRSYACVIAFCLMIWSLGVTCMAQANAAANVLYGVGVHLGMAELSAAQYEDPGFIVEQLTLARELAIQSGCIPADGLDDLITRLSTGASIRAVHPAILALREEFTRLISQNCTCNIAAIQNPVPGQKACRWLPVQPQVAPVDATWVLVTYDNQEETTYHVLWDRFYPEATYGDVRPVSSSLVLTRGSKSLMCEVISRLNCPDEEMYRWCMEQPRPQ